MAGQGYVQFFDLPRGEALSWSVVEALFVEQGRWTGLERS
jgi:hypothetical protein